MRSASHCTHSNHTTLPVSARSSSTYRHNFRQPMTTGPEIRSATWSIAISRRPTSIPIPSSRVRNRWTNRASGPRRATISGLESPSGSMTTMWMASWKSEVWKAVTSCTAESWTRWWRNRRISTIANQTPDTTARVETALSAVDHDMMRDSTELRGTPPLRFSRGPGRLPAQAPRPSHPIRSRARWTRAIAQARCRSQEAGGRGVDAGRAPRAHRRVGTPLRARSFSGAEAASSLELAEVQRLGVRGVARGVTVAGACRVRVGPWGTGYGDRRIAARGRSRSPASAWWVRSRCRHQPLPGTRHDPAAPRRQAETTGVEDESAAIGRLRNSQWRCTTWHHKGGWG